MSLGPPTASGQADEPAARLTAADKEFLEGLLKRGVPDPKGARFVRFQMKQWNVWGMHREVDTEGWLFPAGNGEPARVVLPWGGSLPVPKTYKAVDFVAEATAELKRLNKAATRPATVTELFNSIDWEEAGKWDGASAFGLPPALPYAACLHRLGREDLAAQLLAAGGGGSQKSLQWALCHYWPPGGVNDAIHAFSARADREALAILTPLDNFDVKHVPAGSNPRLLLAELNRRKAKGTFATAPKPLAKGFVKWPVQRRVVYLIDRLEDVGARQWSAPGGVNLAAADPVQELIRIGDPAVPDLIDCVERDTRLTRSVHCWRSYMPHRTILCVREAALTAVMSILRVSFFSPGSTGDNFTARDEKHKQAVVKALRAYWKTYGKYPFDERMMKVLADPRSSSKALQEAAGNLATIGDRDFRGTTVWTSRRKRIRQGPNPAIAKFKDPTAAEAIVAAMDRDLARMDKETAEADPKEEVVVANIVLGPRKAMLEYDRDQAEGSYVDALIELGEGKIVPELAKRCRQTKSLPTRRRLAFACRCLGDALPINRFAEDFIAGRIVLPAVDWGRWRKYPGNTPDGIRALRRTVWTLAAANTPTCEAALWALPSPQHIYHRWAWEAIRQANPGYYEDRVWFCHPYAIGILRRQLDDSAPDGRSYAVVEGRLALLDDDGNGGSYYDLPRQLSDPRRRKDKAARSVADVAAEKLNQLIVGLPFCNPLLEDAKQRLARMRRVLDAHSGRLRRMHDPEVCALDLEWSQPYYRPDVQPLGRAATAADVAEGRAIFHLQGKGKPALKATSTAVLARDRGSDDPPRVLVVQGEAAPDGSIHYGIIGRYHMRRATASELLDIKPVNQAVRIERILP